MYSHGEAGAVEENGSGGSEVGIDLSVPASAPDVSIFSVAAQVQVSPVTGDDAFLGFSSEGQILPGGAEIHNGQGSYAANDTWSLPTGARLFDADIYCSTDGSNTNCHFAESTHVPALYDIALTLVDNTPPTLGGISGTLASSAAQNATVHGSRTLAFTAKDADSGVLSATLTLSPQGSGASYKRTLEFASQCTYESWNACPLAQNISPFTIPTGALKDGTYAVALSVADAAGNLNSESLGTITTENKPEIVTLPSISGETAPGQSLTATPTTYTSEPEAGNITTAGQWQLCDTAGNNCVAIAGATGTSYNLTATDEGHTLRYQETVSNKDGSTLTQSSPIGPVTNPNTQEKNDSQTNPPNNTGTSSTSGGETTNTGASAGIGAAGTGSGSNSTVTLNVTGGGSTNQASSSPPVTSTKWNVSLNVEPRTVHRQTRIKLSGVVSTSPRPSNGKLIWLQARSIETKWSGTGPKRHLVTTYGKWITFQAFRAKNNGTFGAYYTFKLGGKHTYQFQAVAPAEGQYPNPTGTSNPITIKEN